MAVVEVRRGGGVGDGAAEEELMGSVVVEIGVARGHLVERSGSWILLHREREREGITK